ncbi:MAG: Digeranylgeranylglycerophospholipid reductase [Methanomassiliicoccales archaeon PtaU1.Bin124]|nr:MAG: Digeranylgeranylglycerophospholipid reductase [Methanomassiliicoccales archaeon PtaU1.Bin124]
MKQKEIDVLVVGAGPAGSGAARAAAQIGARTLMIDRKKEIGTPVQCGEVVGLSVVETAGIKLPPHAICARQNYTRFVVDRKAYVDNRSPYWRSATVERKIFDKHLAMEAAQHGSDVQADCRLVDAEVEDGRITSVQLRHRGKDVELKPRFIVAADGVHSTVAKAMGKEEYRGDSIASGVEYEMVAKKRLPPCMQIFIEPEIGLGYGWIIPKGQYRANVGLGLVGRSASRREFLSDWINEHPVVSNYFDADKVLEVKTGDAPVPGFEGGPVMGNVLFAGDAAGQTLAFVGEGIMPSYICGGIAGRIAGAAKNDSELESYDGAVREIMGEEMTLGSDLRDALVMVWEMPDLSDSQKSIISVMIMNELIGEEDMVMMDSVPDGRTLMAMMRQRIRESGKPIKLTGIRR